SWPIMTKKDNNSSGQLSAVNDPDIAADLQARQRIAEDLDTTFLVEAGAGSGKTTALVGRMLALVKRGKAQADQIAAITFTNKAADELRSRFRLQLEQSWRQAEPGAEKDRLNAALQSVNQGFIGTIHAFCGRLLRERAMEAGLDPAFTELD